jgi:hypothetical protein
MASARASRAAATTASTESKSTAPGPSVGGATARIARRSVVRRIRVAISPRFAMKIVLMRAIDGADAAASASAAGSAGSAANASSAPIATRHRPPMRRAGRRPLAIQR